MALREINQHIIALVQRDSESLLDKDFYLAAFFFLQYFKMLCFAAHQLIGFFFTVYIFSSKAAALKLNKERPGHSPFFPLLHSGFLKNTEKLSYGKERMYKLTVTAYDCGKNRASEDVLVKISVKPTCKPSWQGIKALLYAL